MNITQDEINAELMRLRPGKTPPSGEGWVTMKEIKNVWQCDNQTTRRHMEMLVKSGLAVPWEGNKEGQGSKKWYRIGKKAKK